MESFITDLDAWNSETEWLHGVVGKPKGFGEFNSGYITVVLREEAETLVQRSAPMMGERANVW